MQGHGLVVHPRLLLRGDTVVEQSLTFTPGGSVNSGRTALLLPRLWLQDFLKATSSSQHTACEGNETRITSLMLSLFRCKGLSAVKGTQTPEDAPFTSVWCSLSAHSTPGATGSYSDSAGLSSSCSTCLESA